MANNRVTYATSQLSIKDNRADATTDILGWRSNFALSSGIGAATTGTVNLGTVADPTLGGDVSGTWPSTGQFRVRTAGVTEYIRYSSFVTQSGIVISERGTAGTTGASHNQGDVVQLVGWEVPLGVQSVSIGTTFNTEDVFTLGQLDAYENVEGIPEIEVSVERVLDGTKPLWLTTTDLDFTTLKGRTADYKADVALQVYPDSQDSAFGTPDSTVVASGMVVSSYSLSFVTDGNFTESITLVGNDKSWGEEEGVPSGFFPTSDTYDATVIGSGVQRSENFDRTASTLPAEINADDKIQSVEVSVDITREEIFQLGQKTPFFRAVSFPITVTTTFEVITDRGDLVNALGTGVDNLVNRSIIIKTDAGFTVDLGTKNKLSTITQEGNDAGGGNMTVTFEYTNSNSLTVTHDAFDPFDSNTSLPGFSL